MFSYFCLPETRAILGETTKNTAIILSSPQCADGFVEYFLVVS